MSSHTIQSANHLVTRRSTRNGQSLIEFAILLPAVLILIMLIVRMMMILNVWYSVTAATNIAVRAAALTGEATEACRLVTENLPGVDPTRLTVTLTFGSEKTVCQFVNEKIPGLDATRIAITLTPAVPKFVPPVTPSATPQTPIPGRTLIPTATPDQLASIDPARLPDLPIRIETSYDLQIVGAMVPAWTLRLSAAATARLETRVKIIPTPTKDFF